MGRSKFDLTAPAQLNMNKLLLICLLGAALVALSGADVSSEEQNVGELSQLREVRAADPGKGKGLKKKDKKNRKSLKKSDKKGAGKKNGDKKKNGKKNGAKRSKKNGKGKKKKNGLKKKSRKNKSKSKGKGKNKDRNKKKARKAAKKDEKKQKKKARKQKKKAEKKKAKKDRKRKNNRKANTARDASSCMNDACINNAVKYMKQLKGAVKSFGNQYNRIVRNQKQTTGKAGKKDEFEPYLIKLRETGGGNSSNMSCNGEINEGATNLKNLYDSLETCKTIINNTCHEDNMPAINMTFLDACKATMDGFVNETADAIAAKGAAACLLWESEKLANMSAMLKDCSISETTDGHTTAMKTCKKEFSFCRGEEDKVSKLVSACSASNSVAKVTAAIAQGANNQAAATAVSAKVNETLGVTAAATTAAAAAATTAAAAATTAAATTAAATTAAGRAATTA